MALVSQDATGGLTQVQAATRPQILARLLRQTGRGQAGTTTATGTTSTLIDTTNLQSVQFNDRQWVGAFIYFTSGTLDGTIRTVTGYAPSTGTLTYAPTTASAPGSSATYLLMRTPFPVQVLLDELDAILKHDAYYPCMTMLSEVADYDMEQSGTSAYAGTNATLAKASWSLANHESVLGERALAVTNTSAGGYASLANPLRVVPDRQYYAGAFFTPNDPTATHTGTFTIYDQSNGAAIETITTTSKSMVFMGTDFTTPAGCNLVQLRMGASENSVVGHWDEVVAIDLGSNDIALPWWVRHIDNIKRICRWQQWQIPNQDNVYVPGWSGSELRVFDYGVTQVGSGQLRAISDHWRINGPLFLEGTRNMTAFSSNTEEKRVNENWIVAQLAARLFDMMLSHAGKTDSGPLVERKNTWQGVANREAAKQAYKPARQRTARTEWRAM